MGQSRSIEQRLRASVGLDSINGKSFERNICASQMSEAAKTIDGLREGIRIAINGLEEACKSDRCCAKRFNTFLSDIRRASHD